MIALNLIKKSDAERPIPGHNALLLKRRKWLVMVFNRKRHVPPALDIQMLGLGLREGKKKGHNGKIVTAYERRRSQREITDLANITQLLIILGPSPLDLSQ